MLMMMMMMMMMVMMMMIIIIIIIDLFDQGLLLCIPQEFTCSNQGITFKCLLILLTKIRVFSSGSTSHREGERGLGAKLPAKFLESHPLDVRKVPSLNKEMRSIWIEKFQLESFIIVRETSIVLYHPWINLVYYSFKK